MMWQPNPAMPGIAGIPGMIMPAWPPPMAMPLVLNVRVEGLKFEYQLTEDDVRKVFARYGEVAHVTVDKDGTSATVMLQHPQHAISAQRDLDHKQLAGMSGAFLRVDFASHPAYHQAMAAQMAAAAMAAQGLGAPALFSPTPAVAVGYPIPQLIPDNSANQPSAGKKSTCKIEVGIENESNFRVGSRVIQVARQIWNDPEFQKHGGKTRLRGKGCGGQHESNGPLALCISCSDTVAFEKAVAYADAQLRRIHKDYIQFCEQNSMLVPTLSVKVQRQTSSTNNTGVGGTGGAGGGSGEGSGVDRPVGAPTDEEITALIEERNEARKAQNYARADQVREYLKERHVVLMDEKAAKGNFRGSEVTKWRFWRP